MSRRVRARVILGSASPRRAEILEILGIPFRTHPAHIEESIHEGESPEEHVERLARAKAATVAGLNPGDRVLAGDTIVVIDDEILGKPVDDEDAIAMLLRLKGRSHRVLSSLALAEQEVGHRSAGTIDSGVQETVVRFRNFGPAEARAYVATGEPRDKAGAYGIQGMGSVLVEGIEGDYSGVVGLPVPLLLRLLERNGTPYRFPR